MEYAGSASGAALGYIVGNAPGAFTGYYVGKKLSQNSKSGMPPIPRKRRRSSVSIPTGSAPKRRKMVYKMVKPNAGKRAMGGMGVRSAVSNASYVGKRANKRAVSYKRPSDKPVTKKFRKAVQKALQQRGQGFYRKANFTRINRPGSDAQRVESLGLFFSPIRIAEAMQVLFANQTPVSVPVPGSLVYPNLETTKLMVKKTWMHATVKNSGQRTQFVSFYQCRPKSVDNANPAVEDWSEGLQQMAASGENPQSITANTLYCEPKYSKQFQQYWTVEKQTVTLTPGQTYKYIMNGPSDFLLDYQKMFHKISAATPSIANNQKFARELIIVYHVDLVQTDLGGVGHQVTGTDIFGGLSVEYDEFFVLENPDNNGFIYPASTPAGQIQNLNLKRDVKVIKIFSTGIAGTVLDVLEANPLQLVTDPVD